MTVEVSAWETTGMHRATVDLLACPNCRGQLALAPAVVATAPPGVVGEGILACAGCGRTFPITDGVARFVGPDDLVGMNRGFARFYDAICRVYDPFVTAGFAFLGGEKAVREDAVSRLAPRGRVIEVSIGTGGNLPYLFARPEVAEVHGLDVSAGQLERCRRRCVQQGWPVDLTLGLAEALPYRDASFDAVLHLGGINFFSDRAAALREMARIARPGARIVVIDETEAVASGYRRFSRLLPGFTDLFAGPAGEAIVPPVDLLPPGMEDVGVESIWRDHGWCLSFRVPGPA